MSRPDATEVLRELLPILEDFADECDARSDIVDNDDGPPSANLWMSFLSRLTMDFGGHKGGPLGRARECLK